MFSSELRWNQKKFIIAILHRDLKKSDFGLSKEIKIDNQFDWLSIGNTSSYCTRNLVWLWMHRSCWCLCICNDRLWNCNRWNTTYLIQIQKINFNETISFLLLNIQSLIVIVIWLKSVGHLIRMKDQHFHKLFQC